MTTRRGKRKTAMTLINGGTTPVVYTDDGRVLGAGERIEVEQPDSTAQELVRLGHLIVQDDVQEESVDRDEDKRPGESDQESAS